MKKYCKECRYYRKAWKIFSIPERCIHPNNIRVVYYNYLKSKVSGYIKLPSKLNEHNNCEWWSNYG